MRQPLLRRPLPALGPDQLADLGLLQLLHEPSQRLAQKIKPLSLKQVADDLVSRHPLRLGHRGAPFDGSLPGTDESERHGGRINHRLRPTPSYTTLWDVTRRTGALKRYGGWPLSRYEWQL